ncbi:hypothetical protein E4T44_02253 [Aureobasidium sp. EXF-8845]|nr:hypothetical protein E4T44_02253 [Aureobasidium sp. EXF-8845]KAI4856814.1 hypothetical protein E4T45_01712 [Aureobasidium sp. EXF-8846]
MVHAGLAADPSMCFFLEGYSQGAVAVVNTLRQLTGPSFDAVKGIFLVGNLVHKAGFPCNFDSVGGTSTRNVYGITNTPGIPINWLYKALDICAYGDPLCDTFHPANIIQHTTYPNDPFVQIQGSKFAIQRLLLG